MLDAQQLFRCMCLMNGMFPRVVHSGQVEAIFVWGRAVDEWQPTLYSDGVLALAAELHQQTDAPVVIPGYTGVDVNQGQTGYPGPKVWREKLKKLGVSCENIFTTAGIGYHTKAEMDDFIDLAVAENWRTTLAVTQCHHALRAMLGTVKSLADREELDRRIVPVWPQRIDWQRASYGSQGVGPYTQLQWIDEEFTRIPRYQAQGDLATLEELYDYLARIHTEY